MTEQQTQAQLQKSLAEIQQLRNQLSQVRRELEDSKRCIEQAEATIKEMEASKFWKMRNAWSRLRQARLLSPEIGESFRYEISALRKAPPIVVYAMGKVGSTSVYESVCNANLPNPVYHIHTLNQEILKNESLRYERAKITIPCHIGESRFLIEKRKKSSQIRWKIVTLIREPIGHLLSHIFHNPYLYFPSLIGENSVIDQEKAEEHVRDILFNFDESKDLIRRWFGRELGSLGIDVYERPFDHHRGFTILKHDTADVLILRLEDLDRCFSTAMSEFLPTCRHIELIRVNVNEGRASSSAYRKILGGLSIPRHVCEAIYSTKYARHFYEASMREKLIQKWSAEPAYVGGYEKT